MMDAKKNIVILGAGFGGLRAALLLAKKRRRLGMENDCRIILINRHNYQIYTPTLYEAATTSKETANYLDIKGLVTFPIAEIIQNTGIEFVEAEVEKLDLVGGDIHCANGQKYRFDYLILALGSETNYFGIPGLRENALPLKTFIDAIKIRDKIVEVVSSGKPELNIVVGGGGSTGVELTGELHGWFCDLREEVIKKEDRQCKINVKIVEAGPSILAGFPVSIVNKVQKRLKGLDVEILANEMISEAKPGKVILKGGRTLISDILVWTGGVKASSLMGTLPLKKEQRGRVEVVGGMECLPQSPDLKLYGRVYGIGDAVCFYDPVTDRPIPGVARAALIQAGVVAENIMMNLRGSKHHKDYIPVNYPYVIPVGGKWAIAKLGPFIVWGFWGWVLKLFIELNYLFSILPFWKAFKTWLKGIWIFVKNDRLG